MNNMMDYNNPNDLWRTPGYDPYKGMTEEERIKAGCFQLVAFVAMIFIGLLLCALLGSCTTTKYVPVETIREVYVAKTATFVQKDSVFCHDSIHVREKGDTMLIEKWHTQWRDRIVYETKTDTVIRRDSIPYPVEVIKEVPAKLSTGQRTMMIIGGLAIALLVMWIGVKLNGLLPRH